MLLVSKQERVLVSLYYLPILRDLTQTSTYSWGSVVMAHLYRELYWASVTELELGPGHQHISKHEELCWLAHSVAYKRMGLSCLQVCLSTVRRASMRCVRGREGDDT